MVGLQFLPYSFIIEFELVFPRTIYEIAYPRLTLVRASTNGVETQKIWYINMFGAVELLSTSTPFPLPYVRRLYGSRSFGCRSPLP